MLIKCEFLRIFRYRREKLRYIRLILILLTALLLALPAAADIEADGKIIIAIDPGHGGVDGGSDKGTYPEKYYDMKLSEYLRDALEADGRFTVVLTRETDIYLKYLPRVKAARDAHADLIISMHCNTIDYSYIDGTSAYVSLIDEFCADDLAGKLLDAISDAVPIRRGQVYTRADTGDSYGVYYWDYEKQWDMPGAWWLGKVSDYYSINTWGSKFGIPSIIIEHGYLTNAADLAVLDSDANLRAIAQAEADAIIEYYTNHEHKFGEYTVDHPSSCTFTGTESRKCSICGAKSGVRDLPADPDNHFWRQTGSAAMTCESDGYVSYVCQISFNSNDKGYPCTVHEYTETSKAPGHDYRVIEDSQPTHTSDGKLYKICNTCGHEVLEIRSGEGHNWDVTSEILPTCESDGERHSLCSVCGETKDEILPALGHSYEVVEDREATHTEDGVLRQVCSLCGDEIRENRAAEGHDFVVTSEYLPACTIAGKRVVECTICGETGEEELPPVGHSAAASEEGEAKICSLCGAVLEEADRGVDLAVVIIASVCICLIAGAGIFVILTRTKKPKSAFDIALSHETSGVDEDDEDEDEEAPVDDDSDDEDQEIEPEPEVEAEPIPVEYDEETNDQL